VSDLDDRRIARLELRVAELEAENRLLRRRDRDSRNALARALDDLSEARHAADPGPEPDDTEGRVLWLATAGPTVLALRERALELEDQLAGAVLAVVALEAECDRCPAEQFHALFAFRDGHT
jgi:hypothetical protein